MRSILISRVLAFCFLSLCIIGSAEAETNSSGSDCTLTLGGYCITIDTSRIGDEGDVSIYIGGFILVAALLFGVKNFMSNNSEGKSSRNELQGEIKKLDLDNLLSIEDSTKKTNFQNKKTIAGMNEEVFTESKDEEVEMTTIKCPTCLSKMEVRKLSMKQEVKCNACGTTGNINI